MLLWVIAYGAIEKLIDTFLNDKFHVTVEDCHELLSAYGYRLNKGAGSHRVYHKKGALPVTVVTPKNKKYVKPAYVNLVVRQLNLGE